MDGSVVCWDTETGQLLTRLVDDADVINDIAQSEDGANIAVASGMVRSQQTTDVA